MAITNKEIILKTKLDSKRDYILLEDVVKILPKISMFGKSKIYNVAYGKNLKNSEIVEKIKEITGCTYKVEKNAKDYSYQPISIQKIQNEFNFNPTSSILIKHFKKIKFRRRNYIENIGFLQNICSGTIFSAFV